jgi:hypothetical protein
MCFTNDRSRTGLSASPPEGDRFQQPWTQAAPCIWRGAGRGRVWPKDLSPNDRGAAHHHNRTRLRVHAAERKQVFQTPVIATTDRPTARGCARSATRRALAFAAKRRLAASQRGRGSVPRWRVARTPGRGRAGTSDRSVTATNGRRRGEPRSWRHARPVPSQSRDVSPHESGADAPSRLAPLLVRVAHGKQVFRADGPVRRQVDDPAEREIGEERDASC